MSEHICQVQRCPQCGLTYYVILGESFPCLECDKPLVPTGEMLIVDDDGIVLTIQ